MNGSLHTTLVGPPDSGDTDSDGYLDAHYPSIPSSVAETWVWTWESDPITATTTFRIEGWGWYDDGGLILFGPTNDPDTDPALDEVEELTVTVTENGGGQGLTPGFWKNHLCAWGPAGYSTGDDFDTVFGVDLFDPDLTLEQAVNLGGGKCNALARHAVAALLNAAHPDVDYYYSVAEVIAMVQSGVGSGDCNGAKNDLEEQNELENVDAADVEGAKDC